MTPMNDDEWMQWLEEAALRELSTEEMAALHDRARQSAVVRDKLAERLRLEQDLTASLADVQLSADQVLARAGRRRTQRRPRWWAWVGLAGCVVLAGLVWRQFPGRAVVPEEVVDANPVSVSPDVPEGSREVPAPTVMTDLATAANGATEKPLSADMAATAPSVATEPPATHPEEPWARWVTTDAEPLSADSLVLMADLRTMDHDQMSSEEFRRWWASVPNAGFTVNQDLVSGRRVVSFDGVARLRAPWLEDTCLRLTCYDARDLTLIFWNGNSGVAIRYFRERDPHTWAAFTVERQPGEFTPKNYGLLTTDSGAYYRSRSATVEVSIRDGQLILSTGQVPLLTVPMSQLPESVQLMGQTKIRGFSWVRANLREVIRHADSPSVLGEGPLAEWAWKTEPADVAMVQGTVDGGLSMTSTSKTETARAFVPLSQPGLFEVIVQVSAAEPGTGFYLGDAAGKPIGYLAYFKEKRTQQLTFGMLRSYEKRFDSDFDPRGFPVAYFTPRQSIRVVAGLGVWNTWCSGNGRHWGHLSENPARDVPGAVRTVGLFCLPGETPRTIKLAHIAARPLPGVTSLAPAEQVAAIELDPTSLPKSYESWSQLAIERKPADQSVETWSSTFALATLQQGPSRELSVPLLKTLLSSSSATKDPARHVAVMRDVLSLTDQWVEAESSTIAREYAAVAFRPTFERSRTSAAQAWTNWITAPCWSYQTDPSPFQKQFQREILEAAYNRDWDALYEHARMCQFWCATAHPDHQPRDGGEVTAQLARWGRGLAVEARGETSAFPEDATPVAWRHPLLLQLNKEAYNIRAELQAALDAGAIDDACRIVQSLDVDAGLGLLPDRSDDSLFVSVRVALASAIVDYPALAERMRTEYSSAGLLRVRQAAAEGDLRAVAETVHQFLGTPAAAEALLRLGDQQMAVGDFAKAARSYESAWSLATEDQRAHLRPRWHLASSLTGPLPGGALSVPPSVANAEELSGQSLSPLLDELKQRPQPVPTTALPATLPLTDRLLQPQQFEKRARFDGQAGQNAGRGEFKSADAFGRQYAAAVDPTRLYVSNRFQVNAYERSSWKQLWATGLGSEQGEAHGSPFVPMVPVVVDNAVLVRRLAKSGIELACLDAANGHLNWTYRPAEKSNVVSDPIWMWGEVGVLVSVQSEQEGTEFRWTRLDARTGEVLDSVPLFRTRDAWDQTPICRVTALGWDVVGVVGGIVACWDLTGEVSWIRREPWLPTKIDPLRDDTRPRAPVIQGDRIFAIAPGGRNVLCLALNSGRSVWQRALGSLQGLVASDDQRLIVSDGTDLVSLDSVSGDVQWRTAIPDRTEAVALSPTLLAMACEQPSKPEKNWLKLVVLDLKTGSRQAEIPWDVDESDDWRVGPWFSLGDDLVALTATTWKDPHRDLVTFKASADRITLTTLDEPARRWWPSPAPAIRRISQRVAPGWDVVAPGCDLRAESNEVRGERQLLVSETKSSQVFRWVRTLIRPANTRLTLRLKYSATGVNDAALLVRVNGETLRTIGLTGDDSWKTEEISLDVPVEQPLLIELVQPAPTEKSLTVFWKQVAAELTPP